MDLCQILNKIYVSFYVAREILIFPQSFPQIQSLLIELFFIYCVIID
jgi:hypothetical protein